MEASTVHQLKNGSKTIKATYKPKPMDELMPYIPPIAILVAGVLGYGKMRSDIKELKTRRNEDKNDFKEEVIAINLSKHSRLKEIKSDFKERIQICHDRIDKQREFSEKQGEKLDNKLDEIKAHVDTSNQRVIETVANTIATAFSGFKR